jgi:putative hydrolase of the HAD superfamily
MRTQTDIRVVWSDFGGVLTPSIADTFQDFVARTQIEAEPFLTAMHLVATNLNMPLMAPLDTGLLTEAEWGRRVSVELERLTGEQHDLTRFRELWFADRPTNTAMIEYLQRLRAEGFLIGMLTNNVREWEPHWRAMLPQEELFHAIVNSCEIGVRKPQPEIFAYATSTLHVPPSQCLLVDDMAENCEAARAEGWWAVLFQSTDQAISEVESILGRLPHEMAV